MGRSVPRTRKHQRYRAQLLTSLRPELEPILYKAWENVPVTPAPPFEVHSFQVRASVFGHNAPRTGTKHRGVITSTKEWDLQLPAPTSTRFETRRGSGDGSGVFGKITVGIINLVRGFGTTDNQHRFPAAKDKVGSYFKARRRTAHATFQFRFARRPIAVQVVSACSSHPLRPA